MFVKPTLQFIRTHFLKLLAYLLLDVFLAFASLIIGTWLASVLLRTTATAYPLLFVISETPEFTMLQALSFCLCYVLSFGLFSMYNNAWSTSGLSGVARVFVSVGVGGVFCLLLNLAYRNHGKSILFLACICFLMLTLLSRYGLLLCKRLLLHLDNRFQPDKKRIMIIGAGEFGNYVRAQLESGEQRRQVAVTMFVDDDPDKQGMRYGGTVVRGTASDIPSLVQRYRIDEIMFAIASISEKRKAEIIGICAGTKCRVLMVPRLEEMTRRPTMQDLREISVSDVMFRSEVALDTRGIDAYLAHKRVLITGGGGSIGAGIARQIALRRPAQLILFDIYENTAYELYQELKSMHPYLDVCIRVGNVREKARLDQVMEEFHPQLVIHAAAHKHVPLMEDSPAEAIKNNVQGTWNALHAAHEHQVERFVLLSTDKAVNPSSVMGVSKRVTELMVQDFAHTTSMRCMAVRFGNVLGSHGSVIPLFEKQIRMGGPVLVTDPEMTRYFMTIPEAAQLVLEAGVTGESGAIYVLDMGRPVKILDLAKKVIRFYGYRPGVDMPIRIIGMRAGEKLHEELIMDEEADKLQMTAHKRIMRAHPASFDSDTFRSRIAALIGLAYAGDISEMMALLHELVPSFEDETWPVQEDKLCTHT